ncbi:hypothetical protein [Actinoplanes sp. NPDC026619]|uniref:hypothetical protein n=1 Tax=Actinoplanes sp. NPDC026619 TaxID=3155798 RepID=UPI0033D55377
MTLPADLNFNLLSSSSEEAQDIARALTAGGAAVKTETMRSLSDVIVLSVTVPGGLALTLSAVSTAWRRRGREFGVLIDARGEGDPRISRLDGVHTGTVIMLSNDGDRVERTDLPQEQVGEYVAKALGALVSGRSATEADREVQRPHAIG